MKKQLIALLLSATMVCSSGALSLVANAVENDTNVSQSQSNDIEDIIVHVGLQKTLPLVFCLMCYVFKISPQTGRRVGLQSPKWQQPVGDGLNFVYKVGPVLAKVVVIDQIAQFVRVGNHFKKLVFLMVVKPIQQIVKFVHKLPP